MGNELNYSELLVSALGPESSLLSDHELMVLLRRNPEIAQRLINMTNKEAKRLYVTSHHSQAINCLNSRNKYRNGRWATHVYVNGQRKAVDRATEDALYDYLFDFYHKQEDQNKSYEDVFEMYVESKRERGRSELTIRDYRRYLGFMPKAIRQKDIAYITEDEIRRWFVNDYLRRVPKKEALKKMIQQMKAVFSFGVQKGFCFSNPASDILVEDYVKFCDLSTRSNEQRSFSDEEIEKLRSYCLNDRKNPHAAMMLVSMETGMRVGELCALRKEDIEENFIRVHRQQVIIMDEHAETIRHLEDVEYTKNERANPKGGRLVPVTEGCRKAINIALELSGDSVYVFHHPDGRPVLKDSYLYYLRRRCKALGISISHNHAFRVAYNARLIEAGADGNERCLVLGHSMQTNERHYSFGDRRKADEVRNKLNELEMA